MRDTATVPDISVRLETDEAPVVFHLSLDERRRVRDAWWEGRPSDDPQLSWLAGWLAGHGLAWAFENVADAAMRALPHSRLRDAALPQEVVRQALYRTHPVVRGEEAAQLCRCHRVSEATVKAALLARPGLGLDALKAQTMAGTGCGSCVPKLEELARRHAPPARRWHGESHATWALRLEESLAAWKKRARFPWAAEKTFSVLSFQAGVVVVRVEGGLTADQEWDLASALTDYWAEGFPEALSVSLDFSLR